MPTIVWSNGDEDTAPTWDGLLDRVMHTQWKPWTNRDAFKIELAARAWRWTLTDVDADLPTDLFFDRLQDARLIIITDTKTKTDD